MASYPGVIAVFAVPIANNPQNAPSHSALHSQEIGEIVAIENILGINVQGTDGTVSAKLIRIDALASGAIQTSTLSTDGTMVANSNGLVPSQKAVVTYVAASITGSVTGVNASSPLTSSGGSTPTISINGVLGVTNGGMGVATMTAGCLAIGQGTAAVTMTPLGTAGQYLKSQGTTAGPVWATLVNGSTWVAGNTSAASAYIVAPYAGSVSGYFCQGGAAPAVPGLVTVTVGSAGAILLTATIASAGSAGQVTTMTNTSGTTTIAAGASMLINLAASGTAFQQSVCVAITRTA